MLIKIIAEIKCAGHFVIFFVIIGYFSKNKKNLERDRETHREKERRKDRIKFSEPKKGRCTETE